MWKIAQLFWRRYERSTKFSHKFLGVRDSVLPRGREFLLSTDLYYLSIKSYYIVEDELGTSREVREKFRWRERTKTDHRRPRQTSSPLLRPSSWQCKCNGQHRPPRHRRSQVQGRRPECEFVCQSRLRLALHRFCTTWSEVEEWLALDTEDAACGSGWRSDYRLRRRNQLRQFEAVLDWKDFIKISYSAIFGKYVVKRRTFIALEKWSFQL